MSDLHSLPKIKFQYKKRLGRGTGSDMGAKSTRGTKRHQSAKEKIPLHFEGGQNKLTKKLPLLRGKGKNRSYQVKPAIMTLGALNVFDGKQEITVSLLVAKGLVDKKAMHTGVKVLQSGTLKKALTIKVLTSKSAKVAIEAVGGTVLP